ncbi:hypothetical protein BT93_B0962 [Corymbia citriodora subsp. variegata]|nr:hypothetical protein BT93_B0962 [Corymbia citriodora subsp. variegata]KAF8038270.1 hypothetical protein BT93_B0962 [Corymbia citriodora subsp. variegata]
MVGHESFEVVAHDTNCCEKKTTYTRSCARQPCAYAEGKSSRFNEVKKEEEESILWVECYLPVRHPYFVHSIRKCKLPWLNVPVTFAREVGLKSKRSVVIEDPLRRMWPVRLRQHVDRTSISGWSSVVSANGFAFGNILMFE